MAQSYLSGLNTFDSGTPPRERKGGREPGRGVTALVLLLLLLFSLGGSLATGLEPRAGQTQFVVIGAPWKGLDEMAGLVAAADGTLIDAGALPNVIFARSESPDFVASAYRAGAWLVLDPVLLRGCLGSGRSDSGRGRA